MPPSGIGSFDVGDSDKDSGKKAISGHIKKQDYHIRFENVGCTLPSGVTIMKGVSGEFLPRRTCAIMGPSGAGKVFACVLDIFNFCKTSVLFSIDLLRPLLSTLSLGKHLKLKVRFM